MASGVQSMSTCIRVTANGDALCNEFYDRVIGPPYRVQCAASHARCSRPYVSDLHGLVGWLNLIKTMRSLLRCVNCSFNSMGNVTDIGTTYELSIKYIPHLLRLSRTRTLPRGLNSIFWVTGSNSHPTYLHKCTFLLPL